MRYIPGVAFAALLAACQAPQPVPDPDPVVACADPRPLVCTMEYAPVCAQLHQGGQQQYASGCNACADDAVSQYESGECPQ